MKSRIIALVFVSLILSACGSAASGPNDGPDRTGADIREAGRLVAVAFDSLETGDVDTYRAKMDSANILRPHHPTLRLHQARAALLTADTAAAVGALALVADMGMAVDVSRDEVLQGAASHPEVARIYDRFMRNRDPIIVSDTVLFVDEPDFQPEGIARRDGTWLLGSVHQNRVARVDDDGGLSTLVGEIWSGMGMVVDGDRLWIATTATEEGGFAGGAEGRSAVVAVDLGSDTHPAFHSPPDDTLRHWFGDLALGPEGTVYVSDSRAPGVYVLPTDAQDGVDPVRPLAVGDPFTSPQGLAISEDGTLLYVADYSAGIFAVDTATGDARLMDQPGDETLLGIDGLELHEGALLAIQNGTSPTRVLRLALGEGGRGIERVDVLEAAHPAHDDPTLAFVENDTLFYVANSQWPKFAPGAHPVGRSGPVILGLPLE